MPISARYKRIFDTYYLPIYQERVAELIDIITSFYANIVTEQFDFSEKKFVFCIDDTRLNHLVKSYFYDIIRYKEFHFSETNGYTEEIIHKPKEDGGKYIDNAKQAAYMVKWISKVKPISVDKLEDTELSDGQINLSITLNELLAYMYANAILEVGFDGDRADDISYQLHYRPYEEGAFERIFSLWEAA